jgi:hypothetical protein
MKVGEKKTDAENGKETANFCQPINDAIRRARGAVIHFFEVKKHLGTKFSVLIAKDIIRISSKYNFRSNPVFDPNCIVVIKLNQGKSLLKYRISRTIECLIAAILHSYLCYLSLKQCILIKYTSRRQIFYI